MKLFTVNYLLTQKMLTQTLIQNKKLNGKEYNETPCMKSVAQII